MIHHGVKVTTHVNKWLRDLSSEGPVRFHHLLEIFEKISRIVGAGRCFGMILNGVKGVFQVPESFEGVVIQIDMGHFNILALHTVCIHGKPMILGCDLHLSCFKVLDGLIGAPVPE